jgi:uncharacterized membrane protein
MNLIAKIRQCIYWTRKGMKLTKAMQIYRDPLTVGDYYTLVMLACIAAIIVVLRVADYIDQLEVKEAIMRDAAERNQAEAIRREEIIVSMLNGGVIINGRVVTMCQLTAAGECRK